MKISKIFCMPNKLTFEMKPIKELFHRYNVSQYNTIIDPFSNNSKIATITNDINPEMSSDYHLDALDFMEMFADDSVDCVLYDPPYSPRQVKECYDGIGLTVTKEETKSSFWSNHKKEIARIIKPNGLVFCFGWNSMGIGKNRGFEQLEIMLLSHGGQHNDTIITVEREIMKCKQD